jgi:hypothetical protein
MTVITGNKIRVLSGKCRNRPIINKNRLNFLSFISWWEANVVEKTNEISNQRRSFIFGVMAGLNCWASSGVSTAA